MVHNADSLSSPHLLHYVLVNVGKLVGWFVGRIMQNLLARPPCNLVEMCSVLETTGTDEGDGVVVRSCRSGEDSSSRRCASLTSVKMKRVCLSEARWTAADFRWFQKCELCNESGNFSSLIGAP